jgi:hypothetical protein
MVVLTVLMVVVEVLAVAAHKKMEGLHMEEWEQSGLPGKDTMADTDIPAIHMSLAAAAVLAPSGRMLHLFTLETAEWVWHILSAVLLRIMREAEAVAHGLMVAEVPPDRPHTAEVPEVPMAGQVLLVQQILAEGVVAVKLAEAMAVPVSSSSATQRIVF